MWSISITIVKQALSLRGLLKAATAYPLLLVRGEGQDEVKSKFEIQEAIANRRKVPLSSTPSGGEGPRERRCLENVSRSAYNQKPNPVSKVSSLSFAIASRNSKLGSRIPLPFPPALAKLPHDKVPFPRVLDLVEPRQPRSDRKRRSRVSRRPLGSFGLPGTRWPLVL